MLKACERELKGTFQRNSKSLHIKILKRPIGEIVDDDHCLFLYINFMKIDNNVPKYSLIFIKNSCEEHFVKYNFSLSIQFSCKSIICNIYHDILCILNTMNY